MCWPGCSVEEKQTIACFILVEKFFISFSVSHTFHCSFSLKKSWIYRLVRCRCTGKRGTREKGKENTYEMMVKNGRKSVSKCMSVVFFVALSAFVGLLEKENMN
jgi:hypothetical protein